MNIFEYASRNNLRFPSVQGVLTVEQLWTLPLTSRVANKACLDDIAKTIHRDIKETDEESFVTPRTTASVADATALEIVKHIIAVRQEEAAAKTDAAARATKRKQLEDLIAGKQNEAQASKSVEELQAELLKLG